MAKNFKDLERRKELKLLIDEGLSLIVIAEQLDISYPTLLREIKLGLTEEELKNRQYIKYDITRALYNSAIKELSFDGLRLLMDSVGERKWKTVRNTFTSDFNLLFLPMRE